MVYDMYMVYVVLLYLIILIHSTLRKGVRDLTSNKTLMIYSVSPSVLYVYQRNPCLVMRCTRVSALPRCDSYS